MAYNRNVCKTFRHTQNNTLIQLESQMCSEVIVCPSKETTFYDFRAPSDGFIVPADQVFTFRGLTNSNQLTAIGASGDLCYRTQYFSYSPGF